MVGIPKPLLALKNKLFGKSVKGQLESGQNSSANESGQGSMDFLTCHQNTPDSRDRIHRMERHAATFWNHYYRGEHPTDVLEDRPIKGHEYGTEAQHKSTTEHMLDMTLVEYVHSEHSVERDNLQFRERNLKRFWIQHFRFGEK